MLRIRGEPKRPEQPTHVAPSGEERIRRPTCGDDYVIKCMPATTSTPPPRPTNVTPTPPIESRLRFPFIAEILIAAYSSLQLVTEGKNGGGTTGETEAGDRPTSRAEEAWPTWACLNRLRTGTGRCRTLMQKWGLVPDGQTACDCGQEQTMRHLLVCPLLPEPCSKEDLEALTPSGRACAEYWRGRV
ncbi:hypothetical protein Bbelb_332400 [Branchiostoma belcheri]|nr:hypothetical protein Bbelb_332400 [Branchiostoma belcheri]